jgi:FkbM family methyltransferase
LDPLAVALPTVVREGSMARSRHGGAILRMFGLDELIAHDETEYLRIAVELGRNAERRAQLRGRVEHRLENGNPVLDSVSFGQALTPIFHQMIACGAQEDKARDRSDAGVSSLAKLSTRLADQHLRSLTDTELVRTVILPSFEPSADKVRHLVDVGACYGEMSQIFLERGWTADLFEPDPACRAIIQTRLASHSDRMRLHPVAVSDRNLDKIRFFKATTNGLSGLGPSPYGPTKEILEVPVVRLADYLLRMAVDQVDFLKVDTEGQDLHVLASHDFATLCPRYLLIEVNTEFPDQSLDRIRATVVDMRDKGYRAIILRYEDDGTFKQGIWDHYWLRDILTLETLPSSPQPFFANIVFFRAGDLEFVERLSERIERALKLAA